MDVQHRPPNHLPTPGVSHDPPLEGLALGDFLRQARESRGMTLQQISQRTKIPERHLDALEHGDLAAIPSGPYRRGEIKAYAQVVGVDATAALARLEGVADDSAALALQSPASAWPRVESPTRAVNRVVAIGVLSGVALVIAAAWMLSRGGSDAATRPADSGAVANQPSGVAPSTAAPPSSVPRAGAVEAPVGTPILAATSGAGEAVGSEQDTLAPADFSGVLIVNSDPPGARVTVNGIGWGRTPVTIPQLTPGEKRVRVTGDGYAAEERVMSLTADHPTSQLTVTLRPIS